MEPLNSNCRHAVYTSEEPFRNSESRWIQRPGLIRSVRREKADCNAVLSALRFEARERMGRESFHEEDDGSTY
jgi:hypothetical protein